MLIRYKKAFEKIAMGLLSFMPNEKDLKTLQQTMKQYETEEDLLLLLWKVGEDVIGLMGIMFEGDSIIVQHISVNPSHRYQGIGKEMVRSLREMFPEKSLTATEMTGGFLEKCVGCDNKEKGSE